MDSAKELFEKLRSFRDANSPQQALLDYCTNVLGSIERLHFDFKEKRDRRDATLADDDRKNLAKAVSGFGNSSGGVLVWGIEDKTLSLRPIAHVDSFVSSLLQLASQITDPIVPGIDGDWIPSDDRVEQSGFGFILIPQSLLPPHRVILNDLRVKDHYYIRTGNSFVVAPHAQLEDMFGVRQSPDLTPEIALFKPENDQTKCVWDVWNSGPAVATAVTLEIRALISGSGGNRPLCIEGCVAGPRVVVESSNQEGGYHLLDCYLPPDAKPIRSVDGHVKAIEFRFPLPKISSFLISSFLKEHPGVKEPVLKFEQLRFDWVTGAQSMRPRRGSFIIQLSRNGFTSVFDGFLYQNVKRWRGRDGEEMDISRTGGESL